MKKCTLILSINLTRLFKEAFQVYTQTVDVEFGNTTVGIILFNLSARFATFEIELSKAGKFEGKIKLSPEETSALLQSGISTTDVSLVNGFNKAINCLLEVEEYNSAFMDARTSSGISDMQDADFEMITNRQIK